MSAQTSPLTGNSVPVAEDVRRDIHYFDDICGRWSITTEAFWESASILGGRLETEHGRLSESESRRAFALARSEVWRLSHLYRQVPLFMTLSGSRRRSSNDDQPILTIEELHDRAKLLTLDAKATHTLENLAAAEGEAGAGVDIPYSLKEYPGRPLWPSGGPPLETGLAFGCTSVEAPLAYQFLLARGLIKVQPPASMAAFSRAYLTPDGYSAVEASRSGIDGPVRVFLICRFLPEIDLFFDEAISPAGIEVGCAIRRVKDVHHIDRIDDRICQEIRGATVVVVDLTEENFNVAFEAGYALALNKPIVWTKRKDATGLVMPFDIYTYNCLEWEDNALAEFRDQFKFRLIAALEKARVRRR